MTSESNWIKEVSKTYLEEAYKTNAVQDAGKKPSYVKTGVPAGASEEEMNADRANNPYKAKLGKGKPAGAVAEEVITNEQLLESFQYMTEEQFNALTDKYLTHLSENYSKEQIDSMTEEQLQEGLMNFARGLVQTGIEKAKALGTKVKQGIKDIEQKGAVAGFEKEKAKLRKSGSGAGHALQQLAAGKAMGSKDASGQQTIRPEDEGVHGALASAYEKSVQQRTKGIGGLGAKIKGKLTGQSAADVIRAGDEKKLGKLEKAGAIKGEELAGRYRSGTKRAVQQKLASHRAEIDRLRKLAGDSE
jgi:hypothetical protein